MILAAAGPVRASTIRPYRKSRPVALIAWPCKAGGQAAEHSLEFVLEGQGSEFSRRRGRTSSQTVRSEGTQEVHQVLLLRRREHVKTVDHVVGLRSGIAVAGVAEVVFDRRHDIAGAAVVHEEDPLANAPEGRAPEHVTGGSSLSDAVGETIAHVVDKDVRENIHLLIAQGVDV